MPADRLLREAASVGLEAMEAGPEDFCRRTTPRSRLSSSGTASVSLGDLSPP
jgi:hypothetical protein